MASHLASLPTRARRRVQRRRDKGRNPELLNLRNLLRRFQDQDPPQVVFLGDSSSVWIGPDDSDKRTVPDMVADLLGPRTPMIVARGPGYCAGIYGAFLRHLAACSPPQGIVMMSAVRVSMTPWRLHPHYSAARSVALMNAMPAGLPWREVPLDPMPPSPADWDDYDRLTVDMWDGDRRTVGELRLLLKAQPQSQVQRVLQNRLLHSLHFPETVHRGDRGAEEWIGVGEQCAKIAAPTTMVATPVNHAAALPEVGEGLRIRVQETFDAVSGAWLEGVGDARGSAESQTLTSFEPNLFIEPDQPHEHLNEAGRRRLAQSIVARLELSR
jgi:hypothetical protein